MKLAGEEREEEADGEDTKSGDKPEAEPIEQEGWLEGFVLFEEGDERGEDEDVFCLLLECLPSFDGGAQLFEQVGGVGQGWLRMVLDPLPYLIKVGLTAWESGSGRGAM